MINVYESLYDELGATVSGRTKLFVINTREENLIGEYMSGIAYVPEKSGMMFIVDDWIVEQVDKIQFVDGTLKVKEGEELIPPVKSDRELQREALLKQLAELDSEDILEEEEELS